MTNSQAYVDALFALPLEERAHAYVQANRFQWPDALAQFKPDGVDRLSDQEKRNNPDFMVMWNVVKDCVDEFNQSRQWWREVLKRTDEEHRKWWDAEGREMTKAINEMCDSHE